MTKSTLSSLAEIVGVYIRKSFYGYQQPHLQLYKDAGKYTQPKGAGKTAQFPRMRPMDIITSTTGEGSNPTVVQLAADSVSVTMAKIANAVQINKEVWQTGIKATSVMVAKKLRKNWDQSLTRNIQQTLARRANRSRIDLNTAYQWGATADSATATEIVDATLETPFPNDDDLTGGLVIITNGPGAGQVRQITDYVASGGTITVATWDINPDSNSSFKVLVTTGLNTAANKFNTDAFVRAVFTLDHYQAEPRNGGMWKCNIDPHMNADLKSDDTWLKSGMYNDTAKLEKGIRGFWFETLVGMDSAGWKEAVTTQANGATEMGVFAAAGEIHTAWFYGADAFGCVAVEGEGEGIGNVNFYNVTEPDHTNMTVAFTTHSYDSYFASCVPFGLFVHGISCGSGQAAVGDDV